MDHKRRTILVIAIAITIMAGVVSGFGLPFFFQNAQLRLPDLGALTQQGGEATEGETDYVIVKITPETVQNVIAAMQRKQQYYRELKVEHYWGEPGKRESAVNSVQVWNDGDYQKTTIVSPDSSLFSALTADGSTYIWYGSDKSYKEYPTDALEKDLLQNIPTYEDVLQLPTERITRAGFEQGCVFVEAREETLGYLERYWISTETGLLVESETQTEEGELLVYSMSEKLISGLSAEDASFTLPDGRVLHSVALAP